MRNSYDLYPTKKVMRFASLFSLTYYIINKVRKQALYNKNFYDIINIQKDKEAIILNTKKTEDKKRRASFWKVMINTFFALGVSFKIAPISMIILLVSYLLDSLVYFVTGTYSLKYVIDMYSSGNVEFVDVCLSVVVIMIVPVLTSLLISLVTDLTWGQARIKISASISKMVFEKNKSVELACYETPEFYDKYVRATLDMPNHIFNVTYVTFYLLGTILSMILYGGLLFQMDPVFIVFALIPLIGSFFKKKSNELWHKHTTEDKILHRRCQYAQRVFYSVDYAKEMRLSNAKSFMLNKYDEASDGRMNVVDKYGKKEMVLDILGNKLSSILANPLAIAYAVLSAFGILPWGVALGLGGCAVVINSVSELSGTFINITNQYFHLHEKSLFIEDLREFLDYEPRIKDKPNAKDVNVETIKLENVSFKYVGSDKYVLKNINLEISPNEKIALVGHNGAGKTTLVKLLLRLYDPTEGRVTIGNDDITDLKVKDYRNLFSVVFQDFKLIALPVIENVLMRPKGDGDEEKVIEALKLSGAYEKIMSLENGIDTLLTKEFSEKGAVLSVGEGQKLAIAHAYLKNSPFVVLDEPTSALDPVAESKMYTGMMEMGKGKGMVFISHRLSSAVSADRIYMLKDGEIIESGTHSELMALNGEYADMFKKQAQNYIDIEEGQA